MLSESQIQILVNKIAQGYRPEKIYLFGSYVSNTSSMDSDVDLFIIKSTKSRKIDRSIEVRQSIKNYPSVGLDIIVYTPEEMEMANKDVVNIGKEAVKNGKLVYERV